MKKLAMQKHETKEAFVAAGKAALTPLVAGVDWGAVLAGLWEKAKPALANILLVLLTQFLQPQPMAAKAGCTCEHAEAIKKLACAQGDISEAIAALAECCCDM